MPIRDRKWVKNGVGIGLGSGSGTRSFCFTRRGIAVDILEQRLV